MQMIRSMHLNEAVEDLSLRDALNGKRPIGGSGVVRRRREGALSRRTEFERLVRVVSEVERTPRRTRNSLWLQKLQGACK